MTWDDRYRKQAAVRWSDPTADGSGGRTFGTVEEILVRWEDRQEKFRTATGEELISRAVVYVGEDVEPGDYLRLGTVTDLESGAEQPPDVGDAYEVRAFSKVSDLGATRFVRKVWL